MSFDCPKACKEVTRTARKTHRCYECWEAIKEGEKYVFISGIWEEPMTFKLCSTCSAAGNAFTAHCISINEDILWSIGNLWNDIADFIQGEYGYDPRVAPEDVEE